MMFLFYIIAVIAIFSTTLYISSLLTSVSFNAFRFPVAEDQTEDVKKVKFRLWVGLIMALSWAALMVF